MNIFFYRCEKSVSRDDVIDYKELQIIDSTLIYGSDHLRFALEKAEISIGNNSGVSSNLFIQLLVAASGQRQIKKALEMYGLDNSRDIAVIGKELPEELTIRLKAVEVDLSLDSSRIEYLKKAFAIEDEELKASHKSFDDTLKDLIRERIALSNIL